MAPTKPKLSKTLAKSARSSAPSKSVGLPAPSTPFFEPEVTIKIDQTGPIGPNGRISGTVTLVVISEKMTRGVVIHCCGDAEVTFHAPSHYLRHPGWKVNPTDEYRATESFADAWKYLLGGPRIRQYKLPVGTQKIPFEFTLPLNLASSYTGNFGRVEYRLMVKIKGYGEKVKDQVSTAVFEVDSKVDLNDFQDAWKPLAVAAKKTKKLFGFCRGIIGFVLEIPHGGMIIGETVEFSGEIVNTTSDWKVDSVEVRIFQSELFAAGGEMNWNKVCIWNERYDGVEPGRITCWSGTIGPIPEVPSTNLGGCHIIRVTYWIQICMLYQKPCLKKRTRSTLTEVGDLMIGDLPFDPVLMEEYHMENRIARQHQALRSGIRYRPSIDEIIGDEPIQSYFINTNDHATRKRPQSLVKDDWYENIVNIV